MEIFSTFERYYPCAFWRCTCAAEVFCQWINYLVEGSVEALEEGFDFTSESAISAAEDAFLRKLEGSFNS